MRLACARIGSDETPNTFLKAFGKKYPNFQTKKFHSRVKKLWKLKRQHQFRADFEKLVGDYHNELTLLNKDVPHGTSPHYLFDTSPIDLTVLLLHKADELGIKDDQFMAKQVYALRGFYSHLDINWVFPATKFSGNLDCKQHPSYQLFLTFVRKYYEPSFSYVDQDDKPAIIEMFGGPDEMIAICSQYLDDSGNMLSPENTPFARTVAEIEAGKEGGIYT